MRSALAVAGLALALLPASPASAEPLICVYTGAVEVDGVIYYDPPDPCFL